MSQRRVPRDAAKEAWWREQVQVQAQSGLTVRAYCRQQQLSEPSFYAWRKELARRDQERQLHEHQPEAHRLSAPATPATRRVRDNRRAAQTTPPTFAEVLLSSPTTASPIEIILTTGQRIRVAPGFDTPTLQAVLAVLERPRSEEPTPC